ncbi:MAG: hypothetical protein QOJ29_1344 [Thermoleophilaceae bacterium]|nr:hypothetical protein [Thermoleophilaceae bacterium]
MQLRGDPGALVAYGELRVGLALLLQIPHPVGELRRHHLTIGERSSAAPRRGGDEQAWHPRLVPKQRTQLPSAGQTGNGGKTSPAPVPAPGAKRVSGNERPDREGSVRLCYRQHRERGDRDNPGHARAAPGESQRTTEDRCGDDGPATATAPGREGSGPEHARADADEQVGTLGRHSSPDEDRQ